ncbi:hypothetical protein GCM10027051_05730 [Niabella terrae]
MGRTVPYASFAQRLAAFLIDFVILWVVGYFLQRAFGVPDSLMVFQVQEEGFSDPAMGSNSFLPFLGYSFTSLIVNWLYSALLVSGPWQATLGKRAMGLEVTNLQGERISFLNATGRYFATMLSAMILFIGYLMIFWSDKKQCLHDQLAGTLVIKK